MPVVVAWFREGFEPRGGDLGGNDYDCESRIGRMQYLNTGHASHSPDIVDFGLRQNAKVIVWASNR
jgi:hypothetical protein